MLSVSLSVCVFFYLCLCLSVCVSGDLSLCVSVCVCLSLWGCVSRWECVSVCTHRQEITRWRKKCLWRVILVEQFRGDGRCNSMQRAWRFAVSELPCQRYYGGKYFGQNFIFLPISFPTFSLFLPRCSNISLFCPILLRGAIDQNIYPWCLYYNARAAMSA